VVCETWLLFPPDSLRLQGFCQFIGLTSADEFRAATRAHLLAWLAQFEQRGRAGATVRRILAVLANLFDHLLEINSAAGSNSPKTRRYSKSAIEGSDWASAVKICGTP
jgi:hypothetical protein